MPPRERIGALLRRIVDGLVRRVAARPRLTVTAVLILGLAGVAVGSTVEIRLDARSLLLQGKEDLTAEGEASRSRFDLSRFEEDDDTLAAIFVSDEAEVWSPAATRQVAAFRRSMAEQLDVEAPGGYTMESVLDTALPRVDGNSLTIEPLGGLDAAPEDPDLLSLLRSVELISRDGHATALYVHVPAEFDRARLLDIARAARRAADGPYRVFLGGSALVQGALGQAVLDDLRAIVPFCVLATVACLTFAYRSLLPGLLALMEAGVSLALGVGAVAALGWPIYVTTLTLPLIVFVIVVSDNVYVMHRVVHKLRQPGTSVPAAYASIAPVVLATTGTTAVGFAALLFSDLGPHRVFGLLACTAILCSALLSLTLGPAVVALFPKRFRRLHLVGISRPLERAERTPLLQAGGARGGSAVVLGVCSGATLVLVLLLVPTIQVADRWERNLPSGHDVVLGSEAMERHFGGSLRLNLDAGGTDSGFFVSRENLCGLEQLAQEVLRREVVVGSVHSISTYLEHVMRVFTTRPGDAQTGDFYRALLLLDSTMPNERERWLDRANRDARLSIALRSATSADVRRIVEEARSLAARLLPDARITPFGDAWTTLVAIERIVSSQLHSLVGALAMDFAFILAVFGSWRIVQIALPPVLIAIALTFALMGALSMPLGIATSMFAAMGLGLGVDFSIHFAMHARDSAEPGAVSEAARATFPPIAVAVVSLVAGLSCLQLSSSDPSRELGLLVSVALVLSALSTLVLGPALARISRRHRHVRVC